MLRLRKNTLKVVKELDAFPKVPESYVKTSSSGGSVSIFIFIVIALLVGFEFYSYRSSDYRYEYSVDSDADGKLLINVDMTVAMRCEYLGADVLDLSGSTVGEDDDLKETLTYFQLTDEQRSWQEEVQKLQGRRMDYRSLNDLVTSSSAVTPMPENPLRDGISPDSCRFRGTIETNKVAGNFHITVGKTVPFFRGHTHLSAFVLEDVYNFSHRIDKLSFGKDVKGIINPLDGELAVTDKRMYMFQYFVQVVPTEFETRRQKLKTNQYSVTERERELGHQQGSHGVPGIFIKYDLSSVKVHIKEVDHPLTGFLVKLCGIIGGLFATSGMLHSLIDFLLSKLRRSSDAAAPLTVAEQKARESDR